MPLNLATRRPNRKTATPDASAFGSQGRLHSPLIVGFSRPTENRLTNREFGASTIQVCVRQFLVLATQASS